MSNQHRRKTVQPPPPLPLHGLDNTVSAYKSYLPPLSQTNLSRTTIAISKETLLDFDSSSSESDHAPASPDRLSMDEHQFWQVHASTTIICPPSFQQQQQQQQSISFIPYPINTRKAPSRPPSLAIQVRSILGSALEEVDAEIDADWEQSRTALNKILHTSHSSPVF
ncbi:hypothetical protein K501DRAFT_284441 [Backusella circina FSU 941]|nr:hypothetical protein K501DRAFT_284439 [Backusella circina FSU 941]KAI8885269.1 hypothetical protein K501DRAFT_284441 [Backusella circina FSU 941]